MNPWIVFLIGVLVGWLIEWIVDRAYWRKKAEANAAQQSSAELDAAQQEIAALKVELENCGEARVDPLEKIKGIGPVIKRKLNEEGIFSFAQLSALTAQQFEAVLGAEVGRLANEEAIIRQAQEFAEQN